MKHWKQLGAAAALGALVVAGLMVSPASAATTTGTWAQGPAGALEYQADVQQPINSANTSNWSAKSKGAIPVQFKLSSRTSAAFESVYSDNATNTDNDYAFVSFTPSTALKFSEIYNLSTNYSFTSGDCHGGSLRWSVRVSATQSVFIYYGDEPNTTDCTTNSQSGTNMIGLGDLRYDTSQVGGTFYDTYAHALTLVGDMDIIRASLVLDSGWGGDQRATISNTTVNDNSYDFVTGGSFSPTCTLPAATIKVLKGDPVTDGNINEEPVQASLADDGTAFRVVDCKYQYILSIPSLKATGPGTYQVQIWIDGSQVPTPNSANGKVKFDLK